MARKRGKFSLEEEQFIRDNLEEMSLGRIADNLNRTIDGIKKYCKDHKLVYRGMSEETHDETILRKQLSEKPYWPQVEQQFVEEELEYFCNTWGRIIKQFREDVLYTEELQIKQWITLEILSNRVMKDRKRSLEQIERIQELLDEEYDLPPENRNTNRIVALETQMSMSRNALSSYTTEHAKILDKIKDIQKDLKAARADRIKKIEDAKSSWAGYIKALEDEELRAKEGENAEIMRLAAIRAKEDFGQLHTYVNGEIDQPILSAHNIKGNDDG